jgi:1-acyl-sn-glycerol-3-phosphate acyltransferase
MFKRIMNRTGRQLAETYGRALIHTQVEWQAALPGGPKIIAVNHPSTIDPFLLMGIIKEPMSILITEACFKLPGLGVFLRAAGHVPVVNGNGKAALEEGIRLLRDGQTVGIFPEGALSPLDQIGRGSCPPHTGVARLALATGVPVIPVGVSLDPARIFFRDSVIDGVTEHVRWYFHGPYYVTVGDSITLTGSLEDREGVRAATNEIMNRVISLAQHSALHLRTEAGRNKGATLLPGFDRI